MTTENMTNEDVIDIPDTAAERARAIQEQIQNLRQQLHTYLDGMAVGLGIDDLSRHEVDLERGVIKPRTDAEVDAEEQ